MTNSYVILTGSKSNAGDYLIKHRAKALFSEFRPDRTVIDLNAWEQLDKEKLAIVNSSKCLILMGGPSLQREMYPNIYKLTNDLDDIKVPIVTMGIGWKSMSGQWHDTYEYPLSDTSMALLKRIQSDGLTSSVRDFHTLNTLKAKGFDNFIMTGCPAYYALESVEKPFTMPSKIKRVAFSLGVSFIKSASMEASMKDQILKTKAQFSEADFEVVFHHALNADAFLSTHGATHEHNARHAEFAKWLRSHGVAYKDISGSAENLINYYSDIDLHVGYRVHAHIFMSSMSKLSVLVSEDGRASGCQSAIGGLVIDGYRMARASLLGRLSTKFFKFDRYTPNKNAIEEIFNLIQYEYKTSGQQSKTAKNNIQHNYQYISDFIKNLP